MTVEGLSAFSMRRREWLRAALLVALIVVLGWLPYLVGYLSQNNQLLFSGLLFNAEDTNVYLAAMQQGWAGSGRFHLLYTPEVQPGMFIYMFYLMLGWLARWIGWSVMTTYQVARIVADLGLSLTVYVFIATFLPRAMRLSAFWLCTVASGLGWLVFLIVPAGPGGVSPIDFWLMDGYTFFSQLFAPHFSTAIMLLLIFFLAWRQHLRTSSARSWGLAWLCLSGSFIVHPKIVPLAVSVTVWSWILLAWHDRRLPRREASSLALLGLAVSPWAGAYWLGTLHNPAMRVLVTQDVTMSPSPLHYISGYGILWPAAVLGARHVWQRRTSENLLLVAWPVAALSLAYFPMQIQRRMVTGLLIPLGILATIGLFTNLLPALYRSRWAAWIQSRLGYARRRIRLLGLNLFIALTLPSTLYLLLSFCLAAAMHNSQLFFTRDEVEAINWLQENSNDQDVILSSYSTGNRLPAVTGRHVVWGHWNLTLDYETKRREVERFFTAETSDEERFGLLKRYHVSLLYFGPEERAMGEFAPAKVSYLRQIFVYHDVSIYQITLPK
jgi:hypothetical protein